MIRVLYISYDGIFEPLGESQVLSYLERLAADFSITLLSFEKRADLSDSSRVAAMEQRLRKLQISWIRLRYHKRPPLVSTAFDIVAGILRGRAACRRARIQIVHARSYVPSLIAIGCRSASHAAFLFDMRGFWVDEKVEAGAWPAQGFLYRVGKWWERRFFRAADGIVSLTAAGVRALPELGYKAPAALPIDVIPTCVDLERFRPGEKDPQLVAALGLERRRVIGCVGTMSNWYMRLEMLSYLSHLARAHPEARFLIVTRENHALLRSDAEAAGVPGDRLVLTSAPFSEMPRFTRLFDAGVCFIRPTLAKRASAATKLAEFLACGVPVVINDGVGDSGEIVKEGRVGLVLSSLDADAIRRSLPDFGAMLADPTMSERCRQVAANRFDLVRGVASYRRLYQQLASRSPGRP